MEKEVKVLTQAISSVIREQLTQCISELQALDDIVSDEGWKIGTPEDYSHYQRLFISRIIKDIHDASLEMTDEELN